MLMSVLGMLFGTIVGSVVVLAVAYLTMK